MTTTMNLQRKCKARLVLELMTRNQTKGCVDMGKTYRLYAYDDNTEQLGGSIQNNATGIGDHVTASPELYEIDDRVATKDEYDQWVYRNDEGQITMMWVEE